MIKVAGTEWEHDAEAAAGITLSDGQRWWGTRIKFRAVGTRRWAYVTFIDLHPFDYEQVATLLTRYLEDEARARVA